MKKLGNRNIIKEQEVFQQMHEEIRKLRNIIKDHDCKIKVIKGIEKENSQRKKGVL